MKLSQQHMRGHAYLFAYGTLMEGLHQGLLRRAGARLVGKGTICAKLYDLGDYPGAKPNGGPRGSIVKGELYRLSDPEGAVEILDRYEDFFPERLDKSLFVRRLARVTLEDGRVQEAWTYFYNRPVDESRLVASGNYREVLAGRR